MRPQIPWVEQAQAIPDCPPGLEYLAYVDCLFIKQQVSVLEAFTGFEAANKYEVVNSLGQRVYLAVEKTDCCTRQCCGNNRPFEVSLYDAYQREVLKVKRYLRCDSCFFPCCLQKVDILTPNDQLIGSVKQTWSICVPNYKIRDAQENNVLSITGPFCTSSCCGDVEFEILSTHGDIKIGTLSKLYSGVIKEAFTDADNFRVTFPMDLNVTTKASLLGAALLIDFMFFEKQQGQGTDGIGMIA
ncbi:hypothetical protein EB796_014875 [Bugula neritina]|uniref:Phospholipid scramblase n=1 Tax=Bugula neritina TaxID=10212 RepID=A0A7J7JMD7_BUGNE|nr:hypothetical protein EB796_014875 [Bugula neritina]